MQFKVSNPFLSGIWVENGGFLPEANFGLRELSLPVSMCVCLFVCLCVCQSQVFPHDNSSPIQAGITNFGPEVQNTLVRIPIFLGVIDLDHQGPILLESRILCYFEFVSAINIGQFKLDTPCLNQKCI